MAGKGRFGIRSGQVILKLLMHAVQELEKACEFYKNAPQGISSRVKKMKAALAGV